MEGAGGVNQLYSLVDVVSCGVSGLACEADLVLVTDKGGGLHGPAQEASCGCAHIRGS